MKMQNYFFCAFCLVMVHLIQAQTREGRIKEINEEEQSQLNPVLFKRIQNLIILDNDPKPDDDTSNIQLKQENSENGIGAFLVESSVDVDLQQDVGERHHGEGSEDNAESAALIDQIPSSRYERLAREVSQVPPSRYPTELEGSQSRKHLLLKQLLNPTGIEKRTPPTRYRDGLVKRIPPSRYKRISDRREEANDGNIADTRGAMANNKRDTPPSRYRSVESHAGMGDKENVQRILEEAIKEARMSIAARLGSRNQRQKEFIHKGVNKETGVQEGGIHRKMSQVSFIKHRKDGTGVVKRPRYANMFAREARENLYPLSDYVVAEKRTPLSRYRMMLYNLLMQNDGIKAGQRKEVEKPAKEIPPSRYPKVLTADDGTLDLGWMNSDMYAALVNSVATTPQ